MINRLYLYVKTTTPSINSINRINGLNGWRSIKKQIKINVNEYEYDDIVIVVSLKLILTKK